ncbi:SHD1 domain-containing protein [Luteolibacter sp. GHJ8]|uniref:SHD1 domain-containing protein n=1 Tax=Luteolibacter rhizosphaerae TaxID=2989719 RepID=A0ABT3FZB9_9BACT|nr:SHD1 domain-containing protein [Luteolibacter rhizosphaerae]MCW1912767.1 SHD1 domain-containing protein [Luteolibacter rhizosphaerae]
MKFPFLPGFAVLAAACLTASAQETRTWTDTKGRKIEGSLIKHDPTTAWVKRADGREIQIPKTTLSEADLTYLKSALPASPAATSARTGNFATVKLDPSKWTSKPEGVDFDGIVFQQNLASEHFLILALGDVKPDLLAAYANAAERLWADIATDLPSLSEAFGTKKMPIILFEDTKHAEIFGSWHDKHAENSNTASPNYKLKTAGVTSCKIDSEFAAKHGLTFKAQTFRLDTKDFQSNRPTWPTRIHFLTSTLFQVASGDTYFRLIEMGFAYHREKKICGNIETQIVVRGTTVEKIKSARDWAALPKRLLKSGSRPDFASFYGITTDEAQPRDLGFAYGLISFIHADAARLEKFDELLARTRKGENLSEAEAVAKVLGFESCAALDTAWADFMAGSSFQ